MVKFRWEKDFRETIFGEIPRDWSEKLIKDVGDVGGGSTPSTKVKEYWDGTVAWITPDDLANHMFKYISHGKRNITERAVKEHSLRIFPSGTVLLTSRAPIGYLAIAKNPVTTNQGFKNIIPKDGTNSEFLFYLLKNIVEYLRDIAGGSTFSELTAATLREVKIPYPNSEEQSRIAIILSYFDNLIENKIIQNEVLEKTAMAIFKSWFMDFEPFKDEEFVDSPLGKMPKGWSLKPIGELAEVRNGISYSGKEKFEEPTGYIFITLNNILRGGGFKMEYSWIKSNRISEHQFLEEEDLIMANTDMTQDAKVIGSPAIVIFPYGYEDKGVYSHHITKLTPKMKELKLFLYLFLKMTQEENATFSTGTNVLGLDIENFKRNKIVICPPRDVIEKFNSLIGCLFRKIIVNQKQIMVLRKIRDALLPLLVFGRLRVEEI